MIVGAKGVKDTTINPPESTKENQLTTREPARKWPRLGRRERRRNLGQDVKTKINTYKKNINE